MSTTTRANEAHDHPVQGKRTGTGGIAHTHEFDPSAAIASAIAAHEAKPAEVTQAEFDALAARVTALEDAPDPPPDPPPTGKVVGFPASGTAAAFATLCKDTSIDVIEIAAGTYAGWACFLDVARPVDRPLLIRPASGAAVAWDGTGTNNTPPWRIGWQSLISYVTWDPAGTGGSFTIQNYAIGLIGLVTARYFDHVAFNGVKVRGCVGTVSPQTSHCVYLSTSTEQMTGNPRSRYWTSNDWDVVGPASRMHSGFQTDHAPNADHITANRWKVRSIHRAVYAYADPTDLTIDGWDIADCNATIDTQYSSGAQGVVKNCKAINSGPLARGSGYWTGNNALTDGGGNTSA